MRFYFFQKILSTFLIFFLLFGVTIRVPLELFLAQYAFADSQEYYDIVALIVDESVYDIGDIRSKIIRYSRDIQSVLAGTKVVILPTPSDATVFDIASLNEKLYLEGYKGLKSSVTFESRLVGSVFIGDIPIPFVYKDNEVSKSMLPYTDFVDKAFIYDHASKKYIKSSLSDTKLQPEIWHGVIYPNLGTEAKNNQALKDYFDKNHDFYVGSGVFSQQRDIINGTKDTANDDYEPFVFYYDQFRENKALQYDRYIGYKAYTENIEDISYKRYTKELAEKLTGQVLGVQNNELIDLIINVDPSYDISRFKTSGPDTQSATDISTKQITDKVIKKFVEIFNGGTLSDIRKQVYNVGRYNKGGDQVNVDMIPFLISILDEVSFGIIKNVNTSLENEITELVANGLSRKIAVQESELTTSGIPVCSTSYHGFYYGSIVNNIKSARDCSIYYGSTDAGGKLVEENRGYNVLLAENDLNLCQSDFRSGDTNAQNVSYGYWAGNSPANLELPTDGSFQNLKLVDNNYTAAIVPLKDILGSKETFSASKNPSPINCFTDGRLILTYDEKLVIKGHGDDSYEACELSLQAPVLGNSRAGNWSCRTKNDTKKQDLFDTQFSNFPIIGNRVSDGGVCYTKSLVLDKNVLKTSTDSCMGGGSEGCSCIRVNQTINYKSIDSYIVHISPTDNEFKAISQSLATPSLPVDKNRYIDFIGAKGGIAPSYGYERIDFPQLFRVIAADSSELTLDALSQKIKVYLDQISQNINTVIKNSDPSGLTGIEKSIYDLLTTGTYPSPNIDLYQSLQNKPKESFSKGNQTKSISYYDTLVFAVYWRNILNPSAKYKFIFENYLSSQFDENDIIDFVLPRHKNSYEIGYFSAPGDAENMYIKLDPDQKADHPYADIIAANLQLRGTLGAANINSPNVQEGPFKCGPPDGVMIWEWIPAIICWLKEMLPPKIEISEGSCSTKTLFLDDAEKEALEACQGDANKNGISDCLEGKLIGGELRLTSDSDRYYYHSPGYLIAEIFDNTGLKADFDTSSFVEYKLEKIEVPRDILTPFSSNNSKVIYDASIPSLSGENNLKDAQKYITFFEGRLQVFGGEVKNIFTTKGFDANVYISAKVSTNDIKNNTVIKLESKQEKIEIRGDRLFLSGYKVDANDIISIDTIIHASDKNNIFLTEKRNDTAQPIPDTNNGNESLIFSVFNTSLAGQVLSVDYPLSVQIKNIHNDTIVYLENNILKSKLSNLLALSQLKDSGRYEISITDARGLKTTRVFDVLPEKAETISLTQSTTLVETGGNISTHIVSFLDRFQNPSSGQAYTLEMNIQGDGIVFDDTLSKQVSYKIFEGYKAFRIKSTNNPGNNIISFTLKDISGNIVAQKNTTLRTISNIKLSLTPLSGTPKVGGDIYKYKLTFQDSAGNVLTDLNSRAYLTLPKIYGSPTEAYKEVRAGIVELAFQTGKLAAEDIIMNFQLEGGNTLYNYEFDILPEAPIKLDLFLDQNKIEASPTASTYLEAVLKDRYDNVVFTDSSTLLDIELPEMSSSIARVGTKSQKVKNGKARFEIFGTDLPGTAYFKLATTPSLGKNSFQIIGQAPFDRSKLSIPGMKNPSGELTTLGKKFFSEFSDTKFLSLFPTLQRLENNESYVSLPKNIQDQLSRLWEDTNFLEVSGIGENAGSLETFYFWNDKKIQGNAYNTQYSVLFGAPYGDVSVENYLAGSLLYDRKNTSLAVTSLLNTPYKFSDVFTLDTSGSLNSNTKGDITQDIDFTPSFDANGRFFVDITNLALDRYIARIFYLIDTLSNVKMSLRDETYRLENRSGITTLKNPLGKTLFRYGKSIGFVPSPFVQVLIDENYVGEGLKLILLEREKLVADIVISGDFQYDISRDTRVIAQKKKSLINTLLVELASNQYSSRDIVSQDKKIKGFYYHDPFARKNTLDLFHTNDIIGGEQVQENGGIGWEEENTMLLSVAAGESVGEATKKFISFSLINLGDPVFSLKALKNNFRGTDIEKSFDATLGKIIADEKDIVSFEALDYNNDQRPDMITIHKDGYIKLYENVDTDTGYIFQRDLVFASDGGSARTVKAGDFTGDGFADIFFIDNIGKPQIFNNLQKDFSRYDLTGQLSLSGSIIQVEVFDMDSDTKDDIVTLDSLGEIHIWYGGGIPEAPVFTKKYIGDGYGLSLSDTVTNHGGLVYFDGLTTLRSDTASRILTNSDEYLREVQSNLASGKEMPEPKFLDDNLVNSFLYIPLPYRPTSYEPDDESKDIFLDQFSTKIKTLIPTNDTPNMNESIASLDTFTSSWDQYISYSGFKNAYNSKTYFLRSEYGEIEGLEVKKTYSDRTPPYLQTGDIVYIDISLKNTGKTRKNNIAYADMLPKYFSFASDEFTILTQDNKKISRPNGIGVYNILIDGFYLDPGEETTIRVELMTQPISYGYMQVGLYEQDEIGYDIYGDIILKESEANCGTEADMYRSVAVREYLKGVTDPRCDSNALDVGNKFPGLFDANNDGVPDYLEKLLQENNTGALQEYSQNVLNDFLNNNLTDASGTNKFPGGTGSSSKSDTAIDLMGMVDEVNGMVDAALKELDKIIEGLSCGFGGGSCISMPLNWAPLAPGSVPTLFGMPLGVLTPSTGIPIFSALTGRQSSCGMSPCCLPSVYPRNPTAFVPGPFCGPSSAGGSLGTWSPTNSIRLYVTPTLTGAVGIAACFGGPAIVAGNSNPMGVHPLVPGGNCVVAAMPLLGCNGDEGDPASLGYPVIGDDIGLIHANCPIIGKEGATTPRKLFTDFVRDYLEYQKTGVQPGSLFTNYERAFKEVQELGVGAFQFPSEPLVNIGSGEDGLMSSSVNLDLSALASGNFQDVVQVQNKRIGGFPNFLMDWVERQLDEITSKLTNLPKIFVILPEFGGIFDYSFRDFGSSMQEAFQRGAQENDQNRTEIQSQLTSLREQKVGLQCSGRDALMCRAIDLRIAKANADSKTSGIRNTLSGIKQVYEFIGKIPLIDIETETVAINIPWIDGSELNRFITDWKYSLQELEQNFSDVKNDWSFGVTCNEDTPEKQAICQENNDIRKNANIKTGEFINSLRHNIEVLESYREIPEKIAKLINFKQVWLEQILCNIGIISELMGKWVKENGQRFKAWVEVFLLVKAALASWQLLLDVFIEYEESCHECKNERHDLQTFIWKLISAVIPSPPIIEFPKWPDIILDFHNIRAGMTIFMPEFDINIRPLVLPSLPNITFPITPNVNFSLPELPLLPTIEIPELPELPSLPNIKLPDLPPPPKIPKLFGAVEIVLNIGKLVTKVMCIIKGSPFVPEWRAGDQIAYITERNGYIPGLDFIDIQPPAFSYSAISAIKVTTYVNFELEVDFITELARAIVEPINGFTNNISNLFNIQLSDMNMSEALPTEINIDLKQDGTIKNDIGFHSSQEKNIALFVGAFANYFARFVNYLADNNNELYSSEDFKKYVTSQIATKEMSREAGTRKIQSMWQEVFETQYTKEDQLIKDLAEYNKSKFDTLSRIISTELEKTKKLKKDIENIKNASYITQVAVQNDSGRYDTYRSMLEPFNLSTLDASIQLVSGEIPEQITYQEDLNLRAEELQNDAASYFFTKNTSNSQNLLSAITPSLGTGTPKVLKSKSSCDVSGTYEYQYKGIYVLEDGKNYRLFDYTELLRGKEKTQIIDIDNDGDNDVLYIMQGKIYMKENRSNTPLKNYFTTPPLIVPASNNIFFQKNGIYYEAPNAFKQGKVSSNVFNVSFQKPTQESLKNFRMTFHTIVDRYMGLGNTNYIPKNVETHVVDSFVDIPNITFESQNTQMITRKNLGTIRSLGTVKGLRLLTPKLQNIKTNISDNIQVNITPGTFIYTGNTSARIKYKDGENESSVVLPARRNFEFSSPINIISVSGDVYISTGKQEEVGGTDIFEYIGKPIFPGTKLNYVGDKNTLTELNNVQIEYYDGSEFLMDLRDIRSYTVYDIGNGLGDTYRIKLSTETDFYYARLQAFKEGIFGTLSSQILLSPQKQADIYPPELGFSQKIRIPVYQSREVDMTPYIYEDGGIKNISLVRVDFATNSDIDTKTGSNNSKVTIKKSPSRIALEFAPFDELINTEIRLTLGDTNGNLVSKNIPFEVYAPIPKIDNIQENKVFIGRIDERLIEEPIRLYRYRGGNIQKLQNTKGGDIALTSSGGMFDFPATLQADGLEVKYKDILLARIDEYTGKFDIKNPLVEIQILPSNNPLNKNIYPEMLLLYQGIPVYRQFISIPPGNIELFQNELSSQVEGIFVKILDQASYTSYRVPLGVPFNPGSFSLYKSGDITKTPVMTILQDGRIHLSEGYRLEYRGDNELLSLALVDDSKNTAVAEILYNLDVNYILR